MHGLPKGNTELLLCAFLIYRWQERNEAQEFERHCSERTAAGCKARFQRVWTQRILPKVLHGHPNVAETVTIISIRRSLRLPLVLFNPALCGLRIDA